MSYRQHRRRARRALAVKRASRASISAPVIDLNALVSGSVSAVFKHAAALVLYEHFVQPYVRDMVRALKPGEVAPRGLLASGVTAGVGSHVQ